MKIKNDPNKIYSRVQEGTQIQILKRIPNTNLRKGVVKQINSFATWPSRNILVCTFKNKNGQTSKCYDIDVNLIKILRQPKRNYKEEKQYADSH